MNGDAAPAGAARFPSRLVVALFAGLFGFYGFFAHGYLENTDTDVTMHAARALYERGDPGLKAEGDDTWAAERYLAETGLFGMPGANGKHYVWFPIGHQLLMVPCVALGDAFASWFPDAERDYEQRAGRVFGEFYWTRFLVSFLPALFAAGSTLMILFVCRLLGCGMGEALSVTAVSTLCTQFWPAASETMSDVPGGFFLLAMAALVFADRVGKASVGMAFAAGVCGGWAVLTRYPHALPVLVLTAVAFDTARRTGHWRNLWSLVLGAIPQVVILLAANWLRFGTVFETGYSAGANPQFWSYPAYLGIPAILLAPGKGILWFSPVIWIAAPAFLSRRVLTFPFLPVLLIFVLPLAIHGHSSGWAAGQCWSVRYLGPAIVLLVAVGLAKDKPWRRWPRLVRTLCALGLLVSIGGVVTPYRGQQALAYEAGQVVYENVEQLDNNVNSAPMFSPLHTHWIYAWLSATGRLERGGAEHTTGPLFGVYGVEKGVLGRPYEDAGFRHWWMLSLSHRGIVPFWPIFVVWVALTVALLRWSVRGLLRS